MHPARYAWLSAQLCVTALSLYRNNGVVIGESLAGKCCLHVLSRGSTSLCQYRGRQQLLASCKSGDELVVFF